MNVKDKVIIITGAAGGLGAAAAKKLTANGAKVVILDLERQTENGLKVVKEIEEAGGVAVFKAADVTVDADWQRAIKETLDEFGRVDVLCNNAGINIRKPVEEMAFDEWMTMMKVNTGAAFLGTKYIIPVMRAQGGGAIINTSSICGLVGHMFTPEAYTATKGALTLFTKSIAARYGKDGIRCNSIHPGTVDTPLLHERLQDPVFAAQRLGEVPLGRLATPEDVANAFLYLCSEEAKFVSGVSLAVDGGTTCY